MGRAILPGWPLTANGCCQGITTQVPAGVAIRLGGAIIRFPACIVEDIQSAMLCVIQVLQDFGPILAYTTDVERKAALATEQSSVTVRSSVIFTGTENLAAVVEHCKIRTIEVPILGVAWR